MSKLLVLRPMERTTRIDFGPALLALGLTSCAIVLVSVLVAPPARGQTNYPWSPREARPVESAGEVVLTFTSSEPGRVVYYTSDGDCSSYPGDPADCGRPQARAGEDYQAVKGDWIFTEAGSRTIRIPIFDDDLDEPHSEAFAVSASLYDDVAEQTTWFSAIVHIADDDPKGDSANQPATTANTTPANDRSSGSTPGATTPTPVTATDAGNQLGEANPDDPAPGDPAPEVEGSAGNEAKPIAADTRREDNFLPMAGLGALALVIIATGYVLKKRFRPSS